MKPIVVLIGVISTFLCNAQYLESFSVNNKGILDGDTGCPGDYTTCLSYDFAGVNWIISGNLTGIDSEGLSTSGGSLNFRDTDEEACWESPNIDISSVPISSFTINFSIPTGVSWESSTTLGSIDQMTIKYSIDGGPLISDIPNQNGCANSYTVSGSGCSDIIGPQNYIITKSGITGNTLKIYVCVDTNASSDESNLTSVSVPESGTVLPVTWVNISGTAIENENLIKWSTANEINNEKYEIEKSIDGKTYFKIGTIFPKTDQDNSLYTFIDKDVYSTKFYYRIKQIDYNGRYEYSSTLSILNYGIEKVESKIGPNPVSNTLFIKNPFFKDQDVDLTILDFQGNVIITNTIENNQTPIIEMDCTNIPKGKYILIISNNQNNTSRKIHEFIKL